MPMRARACSASCRGSRRMSLPSISMMPSSGSSRPRTHFSSTDLPEPEPPMTTIDVPGGTSRSTPSSTRLAPKRLYRPADADFGNLLVHGRWLMPKAGGLGKVWRLQVCLSWLAAGRRTALAVLVRVSPRTWQDTHRERSIIMNDVVGTTETAGGKLAACNDWQRAVRDRDAGPSSNIATWASLTPPLGRCARK